MLGLDEEGEGRDLVLEGVVRGAGGRGRGGGGWLLGALTTKEGVRWRAWWEVGQVEVGGARCCQVGAGGGGRGQAGACRARRGRWKGVGGGGARWG